MPSRAQIYAHVDAQGSSEMLTQSNQQNSPFLRLPAEIRNRIYELASTGCYMRPKSKTTRARRASDIMGSAARTTYFALLQICRQIRHEAHLIFFSHATFNAGDAPEMDVTFGAPALAAIRNIQINPVQTFLIWSSKREGTESDFAMMYRAAFTGAEHVTVDSSLFRGEAIQEDMKEAIKQAFENEALEVEFFIPETLPEVD